MSTVLAPQTCDLRRKAREMGEDLCMKHEGFMRRYTRSSGIWILEIRKPVPVLFYLGRNLTQAHNRLQQVEALLKLTAHSQP